MRDFLSLLGLASIVASSSAAIIPSSLAAISSSIGQVSQFTSSDTTSAEIQSGIDSLIVAASGTCSGPIKSAPTSYWLADQDHSGDARGYAPNVNNTNYPVWRNVLDYGARNDGSGNQTSNLQKAINDKGSGGSRKSSGVTRYPAEVFLPGGTYQLGSTLELRVGTIITGDPLDPPVLKAASNFDGDTLVLGYDSGNGNPETSFMTLMRNVVLDTTALSANTKITALQWGVAQGSGLTNVQIDMPTSSTGHTGIYIKAGSTIAVTDVQITGGAVGIRNSNQQVNFKNISFKYCTTAFEAAGGHTALLQGATFETCGTGINMTSNSLGSLVLLDSSSINSGPVVRFHDSSNDSGNRNSQILIQNLSHDNSNAIAVDSKGNIKLDAVSHVDTWVWGNVTPGQYESGTSLSTSRPDALLANNKYFTRAQPTYAEYSNDQIVNVKAVDGYTVKGDGSTDDSASLNAILANNAANCKITYFPYGVYLVKDTLVIPPGSRIVGEAWAVITGAGDAFKDAGSPKPVVQIGHEGDVGVAEIQNMRFSVAEILPGAKILEINMAGSAPGDVALWNTIATVGGTAETTIANSCTDQDTSQCMAAFMILHLTKTSSAYIENFWGWTADHNLDGGPITIISTGRGILVEATQGTWLTGTGSEHNWLYNYNLHNAENVYAGLLQSESPYMQGDGATQTAPAPWTAESEFGDPDFSWCDEDDQKCRTSLATNVDGGSDILLYNSAAWAFFNGPWDGTYSHQCNGSCQTNMMRVTNSPSNLVWYSISTRKTDVMVLDDQSNPIEYNHPGGWEAIIQAYRQFAWAQ
ncbi:pectate lyase superfamily protein-domain-containing protein [Aspergillus minisclerotigenes]|uniref:Pectate lyase superfamily protein-domain-containing protein n=1 Tax=Aspergillus minisclerotigenes TaxID=656917 RepID=A0A5N6J9R6_9EURO|nr:pectate lyase superfamily protein-domain-containing protein [Aspergillus minisclerotigenes]